MNCFLACLPAFEFSMPTIKFHNGRWQLEPRAYIICGQMPMCVPCITHNLSSWISLDKHP